MDVAPLAQVHGQRSLQVALHPRCKEGQLKAWAASPISGRCTIGSGSWAEVSAGSSASKVQRRTKDSMGSIFHQWTLHHWLRCKERQRTAWAASPISGHGVGGLGSCAEVPVALHPRCKERRHKQNWTERRARKV
eukprot:1162142-Pelagomonas_calceolata.AAC.10